MAHLVAKLPLAEKVVLCIQVLQLLLGLSILEELHDGLLWRGLHLTCHMTLQVMTSQLIHSKLVHLLLTELGLVF